MMQLLHDRILDSLQRRPDDAAVLRHDGVVAHGADLDALSRRYAGLLRVLPRDETTHPVAGLFCEVHLDALAAMLGAWRIGWAVAPLDPAAPAGGLRAALDHQSLQALVADPEALRPRLELLDHSGCGSLLLTERADDADDARLLSAPRVRPQGEPPRGPSLLGHRDTEPALILLHPAGAAAIDHHRITEVSTELATRCEIGGDDTVVVLAPLAAPLTIPAVCATWTAGGRLLCGDPHPRPGLPGFSDNVDLLVRHHATVLIASPDTVVALMNHGGLGFRSTALRRLLLTGGTLPPPQLRRLRALLATTRLAELSMTGSHVQCQWLAGY